MKELNKKTKKTLEQLLSFISAVVLLALAAKTLYELVDAPEVVRNGLVVVFTILLAVTAFKR